jgi:hypothetical protein
MFHSFLHHFRGGTYTLFHVTSRTGHITFTQFWFLDPAACSCFKHTPCFNRCIWTRRQNHSPEQQAQHTRCPITMLPRFPLSSCFTYNLFFSKGQTSRFLDTRVGCSQSGAGSGDGPGGKSGRTTRQYSKHWGEFLGVLWVADRGRGMFRWVMENCLRLKRQCEDSKALTAPELTVTRDQRHSMFFPRHRYLHLHTSPSVPPQLP